MFNGPIPCTLEHFFADNCIGWLSDFTTIILFLLGGAGWLIGFFAKRRVLAIILVNLFGIGVTARIIRNAAILIYVKYSYVNQSVPLSEYNIITNVAVIAGVLGVIGGALWMQFCSPLVSRFIRRDRSNDSE